MPVMQKHSMRWFGSWNIIIYVLKVGHPTLAPLEPIESSCTLGWSYGYESHTRSTPDHGNHWILPIKDHFSKYSFLYPLTDKTAEGVAKCITPWLGMDGIPRIIQWDNGKEFKGVLLIMRMITQVKGGVKHYQILHRQNVENVVYPAEYRIDAENASRAGIISRDTWCWSRAQTLYLPTLK